MRRSLLRFVMANVLMLAMAPMSSAAAFASMQAGPAGWESGEPEELREPADAREGRVSVDAVALGDAGPVIAGRATAAAQEALVAESVSLTEAPAGPELRIILSFQTSGGYQIDYEVLYDGAVVDDGSGRFECPLCTEDELIAMVAAVAQQVAPRMVVSSPPNDEITPVPEPEFPPQTEVTEPITVPDEELRRLRGLGTAGIALMVLGGAGAAAGVVLVVREPTAITDSPEDATRLRSLRPLGAGVLAGGAALMVTGAVLLGIDRKRAKRRLEDQPMTGAGRVDALVYPWFGRGHGGVGVQGRF